MSAVSLNCTGTCCAGDARVLEGHAFVVEAAVSVGGRDIKPGINVYRFANRIPLLFEVCTYSLPMLLLPSPSIWLNTVAVQVGDQ